MLYLSAFYASIHRKREHFPLYIGRGLYYFSRLRHEAQNDLIPIIIICILLLCVCFPVPVGTLLIFSDNERRNDRDARRAEGCSAREKRTVWLTRLVISAAVDRSKTFARTRSGRFDRIILFEYIVFFFVFERLNKK